MARQQSEANHQWSANGMLHTSRSATTKVAPLKTPSTSATQ